MATRLVPFQNCGLWQWGWFHFRTVGCGNKVGSISELWAVATRWVPFQNCGLWQRGWFWPSQNCGLWQQGWFHFRTVGCGNEADSDCLRNCGLWQRGWFWLFKELWAVATRLVPFQNCGNMAGSDCLRNCVCVVEWFCVMGWFCLCGG